jgi:hypothetical protein
MAGIGESMFARESTRVGEKEIGDKENLPHNIANMDFKSMPPGYPNPPPNLKPQTQNIKPLNHHRRP